MNGLSYSQVSGNNWTAPLPEMQYQVVQDVPSTGACNQPPRMNEEYAQRLQEQLERQMAQFEALYEASLTDLQRSYVFQNDQTVRDFLRSHRTIPQLLNEAAPHLRQHFGTGTVFGLRATTDEYGGQTLYAIAAWPGSVRDARMALEQFDDQWWIANSRQASGDLTFTYELV